MFFPEWNPGFGEISFLISGRWGACLVFRRSALGFPFFGGVFVSSEVFFEELAVALTGFSTGLALECLDG